MRFLGPLLFTLISSLYSSPPIVFVYLGSSIPPYHVESLQQARLFNKNSEIYLIGHRNGLASFQSSINHLNIHLVPAEDLQPTEDHKLFTYKYESVNCLIHQKYYTERFFYLDELVSKFDLKDVFYLESDVMLYVDLNEHLPLFHKYYQGMAATPKNEVEASVGFLYFSSRQATQKFASYVAENAPLGDMWVLAQYMQARSSGEIDCLSYASKEYAKDHPLPERYYKYSDQFQSFFDPDLFGLFLHDQGPYIGGAPALVNVRHWMFTWSKDSEGRWVPYATYKNKSFKINNLHIGSKELAGFSSTHGERRFQRVLHPSMWR